MVSYLMPIWMIWTILVLFLILVVITLLSILRYKNIDKKDQLLLIDRNNRFRFVRQNLQGKKKLTLNNSSYYLAEDCGLLNKKGKVLYVFGEGKPQPLKIDYNKSKWLDGTTLLSMINNDLVQMMVKPKSANDSIMLLGAIGGIVAGLSGVFILLIQLGVVNV